MNNQVIKFKAIIDKKVKDTPNFKMYGVSPLTNSDELKFNRYGNISINGDLMELTLGMEYDLEVMENKYGYEVLKIKRDKPTTKQQTIKFLSEVVTQKQAEILLSVYPDIVEKVIKGNLSDIDLDKTKGIKSKTFEVIKRKIFENFPLIDFIEEFSAYGISLGMAKKMSNAFSSIERMREKMNDNPYDALCSISGIGFKKADSMILSVKHNDKLKSSVTRVNACIKYCLDDNQSSGNTWISLLDLYNLCNELVVESIDFFIDGLVDNRIYVDRVERRVAFKSAYQTELYISKTLLDLLNNSRKLQIDLDKYAYVNGFTLTNEQRNTLVNFSKYNISLLAGGGGSGKSSGIKALLNMMEDNKITYRLCTPTGASSEVLPNYSDRDSSTIHRLLGYKEGKFEYNLENKLPIDALICDESSMIDIFLMKSLLEAIDTERTKVLFVQDEEQIASVGAGRISYDMLNCDLIPKTLLTKVFRYKEGGLAKVIDDVRHSNMYTEDDFDVIKSFGENEDYSLIKVPSDDIVMTVCNLYQKLINQENSINNIAILSSMNKGEWGTQAINIEIQNSINPHHENKPYVSYGQTTFRLGDKVIQTKNNYHATSANDEDDEDEIWNGNQGVIIDVKYGSLIVKFNNNKVIQYCTTDLEDLSLAYAISIHKMQGNSCDNIIFITPPAHTYMLNKNLFYTALSRAKKRVFHITQDIKIINSALKKSENMKRNTFLGELLKRSDI